jgi:hypothetical protein
MKHRALPSSGIQWLIFAVTSLGVVVTGGAIAVLLVGFPGVAQADRVVAIGTIFGAGTFVFAIIGTLVAAQAYANSVQRPDLYVVDVIPLGQAAPWMGDWTLKITLGNRGSVAARFIAVRVTFTNDWRWQLVGSFTSEWITDQSTNPFFERIAWAGGADAVVHPGWEYLLPALGPPRSIYAMDLQHGGGAVVQDDRGEMVPMRNPETVELIVEVVADANRAIQRAFGFFVGVAPIAAGG